MLQDLRDQNSWSNNLSNLSCIWQRDNSTQHTISNGHAEELVP